MPHVIVKLWPGTTEDQKKLLAGLITKDVMGALNKPEESVSISIEEVEPQHWAEKVYKPDILDCPGKLFKKPGYNPFA